MSKGKKDGFIQKIVKTAEKIKAAIKFFASGLGTLAGWLIIIIFIVILFVVIIDVIAEVIANWQGKTNYTVETQDLTIIEELYNSGYESIVNAENFQDFRAFEYAVLMDAAEYIWEMKQEKYDIHENQGEFKYEKKIIKEKLSEQFDELEEQWKEQYNMDGNAAIKLLTTNYTTNQNKIDDDDLKELIELGANSGTRNVKVEDEYDIEDGGSIKGGNNRVNGPHLVFEFVTYDNGINESGEKPNGESGTTQPANGGTIGELLASGDMKGALEPYIYVIREDIEFSYYFNEDNEVIEVPLLFNAYNADLTLGQEFGLEASRAMLGMSPTIFPDMPINTDGKSNDGYTVVPYYSDETTYVIYKIPLQTILGRYMPKSELLMAWTVLKHNVDISVDDEDDVVDELLLSIKGVYNEACLLGEDKDVITVEVSGEDTEELSKKTYKYSAASTNKSTFATFQKAGIELTKYDIAGFTPLESTDKKKIKYASDFVSAITVADPITYSYSYSVTDDGARVSKSNQTIGAATLGISGLKQTSYITAGGTPDAGYSPPGSFSDPEQGFLYSGSDVEALENRIEAAIKSRLEDQLLKQNGIAPAVATEADKALLEVHVSIGEDLVKYTPIFKIEEATVKKKLKIWHTRMPVLLVDSVVSWSKNVTYNHTITQNMFKQNNKKYIVPKSVSSIGVTEFSTTANSEYRGKAYNDIFSRMKEKDVVAMIIELEANGVQGGNDCYEFMRDTYKLIQLAKAYSSAHQDDGASFIHENTYNYVYMPDSIYLYDDSQTQKIYWLNLLAADQQRRCYNKRRNRKYEDEGFRAYMANCGLYAWRM